MMKTRQSSFETNNQNRSVTECVASVAVILMRGLWKIVRLFPKPVRQ